MRENKWIGKGIISILLCILGIIFSFSFGKDICLGDRVLNLIGLEAWSNGNSGIHYTIFYSLIFLIPAWLIGKKHKNDFGSKIGSRLFLVLSVFIIISMVFMAL